jgi:uncharacterized membrane protein YkvA (DUF1232 family)
MQKFRAKIEYYRKLLSYKPWPLLTWVYFGGAVLYLLCPFDLIPDFIPVLGWIDDLFIVPFLFKKGCEQIEIARLKV